MVKLEELTLNHNDGLILDIGVFDKLTSLKLLDLSHSGLTLKEEYDQSLFLNLVSVSLPEV